MVVVVVVVVLVVVVVVDVTSQLWKTPPPTPKYCSAIVLICCAAAAQLAEATLSTLKTHSIVTAVPLNCVNSAEAAVKTAATPSHSACVAPAVKRSLLLRASVQATSAISAAACCLVQVDNIVLRVAACASQDDSDVDVD